MNNAYTSILGHNGPDKRERLIMIGRYKMQKEEMEMNNVGSVHKASMLSNTTS